MDTEGRTRLGISAALFSLFAAVLALRSAATSRLRGEEGVTILEYMLLATMVLIGLGAAVNLLGGSISALISRLIAKISGLA
jgi:Flp pilus assembly pilin Flp